MSAVVGGNCVCSKARPFQIQRMSPELFYDFAIFKHTKQKKDALKEQVLISKVTWMNFGQALIKKDGQEIREENPNEVWL